MIKKLRKSAAVAAALLCLPLAACGTGAMTVGVDESPAAVDGSTATVTTDYITGGVTDALPEISGGVVSGGNTLGGTDKTVTGGGDSAVIDDEPDGGIPTSSDAISSEHSGAYLWSGDLVKAGWSGTVAAPNTYVLDVENKTVELYDASAFAYFSHEVYLEANDGFRGYTVSLKNDIDLNDELWMPIGYDIRNNTALVHSFKGVFDGENNTVYNLNAQKFLNAITHSTADNKFYITTDNVKVELPTNKDNEFHYGLFASVGNAVIRNITVANFTFDFRQKNASLNGTEILADSVAAIVGFAGGSLTMENCTAGTVGSEDVVLGADCAGGVVARVYPGYAKNQETGEEAFGKNNDDSSTTHLLVAGTQQEIVMRDCVNHIGVGTTDELNKKGGILAYTYFFSAITFENCVNYGDIYGAYVGGLTSYTQDGNCDIYYKGCANYGDIYQYSLPVTGAVSFHAGGIAGRIESSGAKSLVFEDCVNYGNVNGVMVHSAGGLVGKLVVSVKTTSVANRVERCFNYGNVNVENEMSNTTNNQLSRTGGMFGDFNISGTLSGGNCGTVTGKGVFGGCIGYDNNSNYKTLYLVNAYSGANKVGNK